MKKIANKNARSYVRTLKPFIANNTKAEFTKNQRFYVVLSYQWFPIYVYDMQEKIWYKNIEKYSCTTSKHSTQLNPLCCTTIANTAFLKNLINK